MILEVINPSDKVFIEIDKKDLEYACFATQLLGDGKYGLTEWVDPEPKDNTEPRFEMPLLMFSNPNKWWIRTFGHNVKEFMDGSEKEKIGKVFAHFYNEGEVTSMNDIVASAHKYAKALMGEAEYTAYLVSKKI